jgi:FixJ family two-component response regulator
MHTAKPTVFVVDDDVSVRESLRLLVESLGWQPETFASAREFLSRGPTAGPSCVLLDLMLPDLSGLDVQRLLSDRSDLPIIIITGHADVTTTVCAMKAGAFEFLIKPFCEGRLVSAIRNAIERSRLELEQTAEMQRLRNCYASLSRREQEVMGLVVSGRLNKQVGGELGISEITVKAHRGKLMRKMNAGSLPELVMMAARLCLTLRFASANSLNNFTASHNP